MQDPEEKLWYHSYWVKRKSHYPGKPLFWGRDNGWVLATLPMIAESLGYFQGYRLGWLDDSYLERARASFRTLSDNLIIKRKKVYMGEISGPTIPLQLFPYLGYRLIPKAHNFCFGVATLILAAIEYDKTLPKEG